LLRLSLALQSYVTIDRNFPAHFNIVQPRADFSMNLTR